MTPQEKKQLQVMACKVRICISRNCAWTRKIPNGRIGIGSS